MSPYKKSHLKPFYAQTFKSLNCAFEVRQRALEQVLQLRATCGGRGSVSTRTRSSSARRSTTTVTVPFPASYRAASSAATSRTPSCTMAPSCASCPNCLWSCSTRQSVRRFARCRNASGLCLQCVRKAAECAPGQLQLEAEQRQRRVACVEGHLAARAGEVQRVARHRLAAHAATQGTRALSCLVCVATQGT